MRQRRRDQHGRLGLAVDCSINERNMPIVNVANLKIHYRTAGSGGTTIVFLHGNYASSRWWVPLLENLPEGYRALAPDLRGCGGREGRTTRGGIRKLTIQDLANDLAGFLNALDIPQAAIVGHSLGGQIATTYAIQHPEKVRALILEDTGPADGIPLGSITSPLLLPLELKNRRMIRRALTMAGVPKSGAFSDSLIEDALSAPRGLYYKFSRAAARWKANGDLKKITAPTLLIWGEADDIMPSRYARAYLEQIPDVQLVLVPMAGHSPHLEQPEQFSNQLYAFLDRHARSEEGSQTRNYQTKKVTDL